MPIYEYKCTDCDKEFETLVIDADEAVICCFCDSKNLEKKFSPFGVKPQGEVSSAGMSGSPCGCTPASCGCSVRN